MKKEQLSEKQKKYMEIKVEEKPPVRFELTTL